MQRRGYCVEYAYKLLSVQVLFTIISDKLQRGLIKILDQIYFLIQIFFFFGLSVPIFIFWIYHNPGQVGLWA